ncbi:MAG: MarR family winged helix-turn-helix transcriptional regulator [Nitrospirota bacterium]|jgi:DNA-binding MarR family transcriptional regulator
MNEKEAEKLAKAVAAECIGVRVRILNRVITNIFDHALQPLDLKLTQGNILVMLSLYGGASPGDIGKVLLMEKSTVSRNLERMRKKGWIDVAGRDDGQAQVVSVTAKGRKLLEAAHVAWKKAQKEAIQLLGEEGVSAVHKLHETVSLKKAK